MDNVSEVIKFFESDNGIFMLFFGSNGNKKPNRPQKKVFVQVPNDAIIPAIKAIGQYMRRHITDGRYLLDIYSLLRFLDSIFAQMQEQEIEVKELNRGLLQVAIKEIEAKLTSGLSSNRC